MYLAASPPSTLNNQLPERTALTLMKAPNKMMKHLSTGGDLLDSLSWYLAKQKDTSKVPQI